MGTISGDPGPESTCGCKSHGCGCGGQCADTPQKTEAVSPSSSSPVSAKKEWQGHTPEFFREGGRYAAMFALAFTLLGLGVAGQAEYKEIHAAPAFSAATQQQRAPKQDNAMQKYAGLLIVGLGLFGLGGASAYNYGTARSMERRGITHLKP